MAGRVPRKAARNRWIRDVVRHLEDFPRQYAALESSMAAFGGNFDPQQFKASYNTLDDMEAYNRVQAVERAVGRVQNYVAVLADAGTKLAGLQRSPTADRSVAEVAFEAMRTADVIDGALCARLVRAQTARRTIEHSYVQTPAGDVHRAAELVHATALEFISRYREWIEPYLEDATARDGGS